MSKLQPVIKWSGSKRTQAEQIVSFVDKSYDTYYESFCGGCSVLFYILNYCPDKFKHYVANDLNEPLIKLYNLIKEKPLYVYEVYKALWNELNKDNDLERKKEVFSLVRSEFNKNHQPELFFFIMRTTTNGMPRYNSNGDFNNSFHVTRNGINPEKMKDILFFWSTILNKYKVSFISGSYDNIVTIDNDFLYLDPPYTNTKGMYYGCIDYEKLWNYLRNQNCDYFLSFDGIAGEENNIFSVPADIYTQHKLIKNGNSSFRRVIGNNTDVMVYESLYLKINSLTSNI